MNDFRKRKRKKNLNKGWREKGSKRQLALGKRIETKKIVEIRGEIGVSIRK